MWSKLGDEFANFAHSRTLLILISSMQKEFSKFDQKITLLRTGVIMKIFF